MRPANRDLARRRTFFLRLRIDDLAFDAGQGGPDRANHVVVGRVDECGAGGFGQAVGLQNVDAQSMEVARDLRVETRAAGHQIAHAVAEGGMNLAKEELSRH